MKFTYAPPPFDGKAGIRLEWEPSFEIEVRLVDRQVVLRANRPGLVTLAKHMLTLAQELVPEGSHLHYDPGTQLEEGSAELVIERGGID